MYHTRELVKSGFYWKLEFKKITVTEIISLSKSRIKLLKKLSKQKSRSKKQKKEFILFTLYFTSWLFLF